MFRPLTEGAILPVRDNKHVFVRSCVLGNLYKLLSPKHLIINPLERNILFLSFSYSGSEKIVLKLSCVWAEKGLLLMGDNCLDRSVGESLKMVLYNTNLPMTDHFSQIFAQKNRIEIQRDELLGFLELV